MGEICLRVLLLLPLLWFAGCGNSGYAPVIDRYDSAGRAVTTASGRSVHIVARGDTLYSIAWRHGKDFRQLAAANNIAAPYTIYPGQQIRLDGTAAPAASRPAITTAPPSSPAARPAAPTASRPPV
ncbi:MAG: metalloendopeptidase, partial [Gammaproteobacteria bacterium HGW-Gammaproteobacteria-14]